MHNLKHSATVEIPLLGFSFWEEDEERLWNGNNQDMGEWEGSVRFIQHLLHSHPAPNVFLCQL